jgi:hypothetical protein
VTSVVLLLALYGLLALRGLAEDVTSDEALYVAAIRTAADRLPAFTFDYYLPTPPLGVEVYGWVSRVTGGSVLALRLASLLCVAGTVLLAAADGRRRRPSARRGGVLFLAFASPLVFEAAYSAKTTALALFFAAAGTVAWMAARDSGRLRTWGLASALIAAAVLTSQLCAALALAFGVSTLVRRTPLRARWKEVVLAALPTVVAGALVLAWGGFQPPAYRAYWLEADVARVTARPGQWMAGGAILGFLLVPGLGITLRRLVVALVLAVPAGWLFHESGILRPFHDSSVSLNGPLRFLVERGTWWTYPLTVAVEGLLASLGFVLLVAEGRRGGRMGVVAAYALLYVAMMNSVPYYFERYWVFLWVPLAIVAAPVFHERTARATGVLRAGAIAANLKMTLSAGRVFSLVFRA